MTRPLSEEEIEYYYTLLKEEITDYNCGTLCAPYYKGIPYCCVADQAVPLIYKSEFNFLKSRTDLWYKWKPGNEEDKELLSSARSDQVFCECRGVAHCDRRYRSITCRTFPLEPYFDRKNVFVGLTFLEDFLLKDPESGKVKCPLTSRKKDIRQEFIDEHFIFWEKLLLRLPDEAETYQMSSASIRKYHKKINKKVSVLFPSWYKNMKIMHQYTD
jgi:hypothetical protein